MGSLPSLKLVAVLEVVCDELHGRQTVGQKVIMQCVVLNAGACFLCPSKVQCLGAQHYTVLGV